MFSSRCFSAVLWISFIHFICVLLFLLVADDGLLLEFLFSSDFVAIAMQKLNAFDIMLGGIVPLFMRFTMQLNAMFRAL